MSDPVPETETRSGGSRRGSPITQSEEILAAPRPDAPMAAHPHDDAMEAVPGGRVRRIVFPGGRREQPEPVETPPAPEPLQEQPRRQEPLHEEPSPHAYVPRHHASIEEIERDVDRITGRRRHVSTATTQRTWERTVYETPGGAVRRAGQEGAFGRHEGLYVSRREGEGGVEQERRFSTTEIDRLVAGRSASGSRSEVLEERRVRRGRRSTLAEEPSGLAEGDAGEPEPAAETEELDLGAGGALDEDLSQSAHAATQPYYDFKGEVYPIREVEGIGPKYAKRLHLLGIASTARLCYEDTADLAARMELAEKTVASWKAMAELMKVKGIGGQYAEALARAGITGIQELKDRSAASIADQVSEFLVKQKRDILGSPVTEKRVKNWQKAAKKMRRVRMSVPEE